MTRLRLHKYLAQCGVASRRQAEALIAAGRVRVDAEVVSEQGRLVAPESQRITCDGREVRPATRLIYILLNKPKGYVTTTRDPQGRPTVLSLLPPMRERLFPVGRLDLDTEGALLLTNDGEFAHRVLHPSFDSEKTYEAVIRGAPDGQTLQKLARGLVLEDGPTAPCAAKFLAILPSGHSRVRIVLHEGRKRQVKRMLAAVGHPVLALRRTAYGRLRLDGLAVGEYRFLSADDLKKFFL
ncbi:MAG: rRNA pseudouridine synthase [Desulfobulbaceae bacterium]|jgi:pseudouridine synthase|nr:rRNA pseudouridine synthase [Desulfobulbaceae bacterium]